MKMNKKVNKEKATAFMKRLLPQIVVQVILILFTAAGSYMLMTWLIADLAKVQAPYLAAAYETLGSMVIMIGVLVTIYTGVYRKRVEELNTISKAISRVAGGDYQYRIEYKKKEAIAAIYEDFNKMTKELSSVQLLRTDFINNYSHEFKTPIASINGFAELLMERELAPEEQRQYLEIIRDESARLTALAQNTILLSKLSNQQIVSDLVQYNLGEQLRQCSIVCSRNWMEKKQVFSGNFPDISYCGNRELMQHLWINLLNNAIKYTPNGGELFFGAEQREQSVWITVTDTGEGMSEETKQHLFEPYYQGDSSRSVQGLGLGLAIVKRIVELCEGEIQVESKLGEGTTITVVLPLERRKME